MTSYRVKVDVTYTTTANAATATTNINNVLSQRGFTERAVASNTNVYAMITGIPTQAAAEGLIVALNSAWSSVARSYGKVSVVRTDDLT